jgi:murein DD-endopeptidase MepM/ murein hydrolase activator NlpD
LATRTPHASSRGRTLALAALVLFALVLLTLPATAHAVQPGANGWYWPTGQTITSHDGWMQYRPWYTEGVGWHLAIDICRPYGSPVHALSDGVVLESRLDVGGYGPGGGDGGAMVVAYTAADGTPFKALYGHIMDNRFVKGQRVRAGDVLAWLNAYDPPHVHFGIHPGMAYPAPIPAFPNAKYVGIWMGHTHEYSVDGAGVWHAEIYGWTDPVQFLNDHAAPPVTKDTTPPVTVSDVKATYPGPTSVHFAATDDYSGVTATYWRLDGGPQTTGTALGASTVGAHTLEFWSVDEAGNEETPHKTATLSITGTAVTVVPLTIHRFYNVATGTHFYTADTTEKDRVIRTMGSVYRYEGVGYTVNYASPGNTTQLWRFYNRKTGTHFYTADAAEKDRVVKTMGSTYSLDGPAYYVSASSDGSRTPVFRFYNVRTGTHFYTATSSERDMVINTLGWLYRYEGPAFGIAP